jgi:hypothetical protein
MRARRADVESREFCRQSFPKLSGVALRVKNAPTRKEWRRFGLGLWHLNSRGVASTETATPMVFAASNKGQSSSSTGRGAMVVGITQPKRRSERWGSELAPTFPFDDGRRRSTTLGRFHFVCLKCRIDGSDRFDATCARKPTHIFFRWVRCMPTPWTRAVHFSEW